MTGPVFRDLPLALLWLGPGGECLGTRVLEDFLELDDPTLVKLTECFELLDEQGRALDASGLPWTRAQRGEVLDVGGVLVDRRSGRRRTLRIRAGKAETGMLLQLEERSHDPELLRTVSLLAQGAVSTMQARGRGSMAASIASVLAQVLHAELVMLHGNHPGTGELALLGRSGLEDEPMDEWLSLPLEGDSLPAQAGRKGAPVELEVSSGDASHWLTQQLADLGMAYAVALPLSASRALEGTVLVARAQRGALSAVERCLLEAISGAGATWLSLHSLPLEQNHLDARVFRRSVVDALLELCPAGVLLFAAPDGELVTMNRHARELFGRDLGGSTLWWPKDFGLVQADGKSYDAVTCPLMRGLAGESVRRELVQAVRPSGSRAYVQLTTVPVRSGAETVALLAWLEPADLETLGSLHRVAGAPRTTSI